MKKLTRERITTKESACPFWLLDCPRKPSMDVMGARRLLLLAFAILLSTPWASAEEKPSPFPLLRPGGSPLVRRTQERLKQQRYYKGTPDGVMDAQTKRALRRYQEERHLESCGCLTLKTAKALGFVTSLDLRRDRGSRKGKTFLASSQKMPP
jgi:hypothetical protein